MSYVNGLYGETVSNNTPDFVEHYYLEYTNSAGEIVTVEANAENLPEVGSLFLRLLRGAGFGYVEEIEFRTKDGNNFIAV